MKKNFNFDSQSGFTLVEMLLYMGIFSMLLVILLQLFSAILSTHAESQATSSVDQDGNYILARLSYDIHNSSTITAPSPLGTSCSAPITPTCQLVITDGITSKTYSINSGNLILQTGGNNDQLNSTNTTISNITFKTLGNTGVTNPKPSVQILLTVQSKTLRSGGVNQTKNFQTTIGVR